MSAETRRHLDVTERTSLDFRMSPSKDEPRPRTTESGERPARRNRAEDSKREGDEEKLEEPVEISVELVDATGGRARLSLAPYGTLRKPLVTNVLRRGDLEKQRFPQRWEMVLQSVSIPLADFRSVNPALEMKHLLPLITY